MGNRRTYILSPVLFLILGGLFPFELCALTLKKPHKASSRIGIEKNKPDKMTPSKTETPPPKVAPKKVTPKKTTPKKALPPPVKVNPKKEKKSRPQKTASAMSVEDIPRLSVGLAYTGAQVRWRLGRRWGLEARYLKETAAAETGDVTADVMSGRLYLFSRGVTRFTFYGGGEGGSVVVKTAGSNEKISGTVLGGFTGLEYRLAKRISWGLDVGLYQISLKKTAISVQDSGMDVVFNSFLNFHLF
jgi:hypothetical protein